MKIKDFCKSERPRERLRFYGVNALSNSELLAIILGHGTKKENVLVLANRLLTKYDLGHLSCLSITELKNVFGIGEAKACQIVACFELGRRRGCFNSEEKATINSAKDISKLFLSKMSNLKKENFCVVYLDSRRKIIKDETVFVGTLNASIVHPRAIIVMHNHPSGDSNPSSEDLEITKQLISCGKILDIEVLDHVIFGNNSYYSLRENGAWE